MFEGISKYIIVIVLIGLLVVVYSIIEALVKLMLSLFQSFIDWVAFEKNSISSHYATLSNSWFLSIVTLTVIGILLFGVFRVQHLLITMAPPRPTGIKNQKILSDHSQEAYFFSGTTINFDQNNLVELKLNNLTKPIFTIETTFNNDSTSREEIFFSAVNVYRIYFFDTINFRIQNSNIDYLDVTNSSTNNTIYFNVKPLNVLQKTLPLSISFRYGRGSYSSIPVKLHFIIRSDLFATINFYIVRYYQMIVLFLVIISLVINRLIPIKVIHINKIEKNTNYMLRNTLVLLLLFFILVSSAVLFNYYDIPFLYLVFVVIALILLFTLISALSLRQNKELSEENFLTLWLNVLKKIPGLGSLIDFFTSSKK